MPSVFKWKCSYYCNSHWKWRYGNLCLSVDKLKFRHDGGSNDCCRNTVVIIPFGDILEVRKSTTTFIFQAITVRETKSNHWFSSFNKIYDVLATIQHFWKERLVGEDCPLSTSKETPKNELFELLYDSQSTLMSSAKQLHSQGQQLRATSAKLLDIDRDIKVGENFVSDLESWFGLWKTKQSRLVKSTIPSYEQGSGLFRADYLVLLASSQQESHKEAVLSFQGDKMVFKDKGEVILYSFVIHELSGITVHSPWDFTLSKVAIGKRGTELHVISTRIPFILQTLEKAHKYKPLYEDPPSEGSSDQEDDPLSLSKLSIAEQWTNKENFASSSNAPNREKISRSLDLSSSKKSAGGMTGKNMQPKSQDCHSKQSQGQTSSPHLTASEADQMSSVLQSMKSLALDIGKEQERQIQDIEDMTAGIEKTNERLKKNTRRINTLL